MRFGAGGPLAAYAEEQRKRGSKTDARTVKRVLNNKVGQRVMADFRNQLHVRGVLRRIALNRSQCS